MMLREIIGQARAWIVGLFRRAPPDRDLGKFLPPPEPETIPTFPTFPEPASPPAPKPAPPDDPPRGSFVHLEDILDDLPDCRRSLRKLRKFDADAFAYHHRLGARVLSDRAMFLVMGLDDGFARNLPASGMVFTPRRHWTDDSIFPTFIYFTKVERSNDFHNVPDDARAFYRVTVLFIDVTRKNGSGKPLSGGVSYSVAIRQDNSIHLLKQPQREIFRTPHADHYKRKPIGNGRWGRHKVDLPRGKAWRRTYIDYAPGLYMWVRDALKRGKSLTPQELTTILFAGAANCYALSVADDFQVRAERDGVSVAFSVALGRTPHFFRDRQTTAATDGKRKRIFHGVVRHDRTLASGKVITVKAHYRGERRFDWFGERITITAPEDSLISWREAAREVEADVLAELPPGTFMLPGETAEFVRSLLEDHVDPRQKKAA
jgi:hypothetical protein